MRIDQGYPPHTSGTKPETEPKIRMHINYRSAHKIGFLQVLLSKTMTACGIWQFDLLPRTLRLLDLATNCGLSTILGVTGEL